MTLAWLSTAGRQRAPNAGGRPAVDNLDPRAGCSNDDSAIIIAMQLGKISAEDLRLLLSYFPSLFAEQEETRALFRQNRDAFFADDCQKPLWCRLYESPAKEAFASVMLALDGEDVLKTLAAAPNQIQAMPGAIAAKFQEIDEWKPDAEETEDFRKSLAVIFGMSMAVVNSFRCLLIFGHYLNDLVAMVRTKGPAADHWLFAAVKIDITVLGCPSIMARVSRAVMEGDPDFQKNLRKAMTGKLTKREQKTYQDMRLVLQVLHETGAPKLSTDDLYTLFHDELNIVRSEAGDGDVRAALRQFAYQFMEGKAVSQT